MELLFEFSQSLGAGTNPACAHFATNDAQVFYIQDGKMYAISTTTPMGDWADRVFTAPIVATSDANIKNMSLKSFPRYGLYGVWWSDDRHRFAIYEFEIIISEYLENGSITSLIDNPISSVNLSLHNPDEAFLGEDEGILSPGARLYFAFRAGDSEPFEMGTFYADRSTYDVTKADAQVSGRNTIGKILKDQTFDELNQYPYQLLSDLLIAMLRSAGLPDKNIAVYTDADIGYRGMNFPPDMTFFDGILEVFKTAPWWLMQEQTDGTIVVGVKEFEKFSPAGKYTFYRDKDIFSRQVSRDDASAYSRVCVRTEDKTLIKYEAVTYYDGWGLPSQKTLYATVPNGTTQEDVDAYALELADKVSQVGVIESFTGPIRPQLMTGDEAEIISDWGTRTLGIITEVTHNFGRGGIYTGFTVDSGGAIGRGRISDFITKIAGSKVSGGVTRVYV